ncbi:MAG: hypothetical protein HZA25_03550 [Candidatus Niyogibacteria bacterium]|nr:hypothetical protein [Candidatus Niyogibacteria bacterium]
MTKRNKDEDSDDLMLDLLVIPTGQDVVFPGQSCEITVFAPKNSESEAFIGLLKKIVKERSLVVFTVVIGKRRNQPEFSGLVTLGMITELKFAADFLALKVVAIGRAEAARPYQLYYDGKRRYESVFSVGVMPIFESIVTNSEWSGIEYALTRGAIARDIEELLRLTRRCVNKMRELAEIDKSNERQFEELLATLIQATAILGRAVSADDFERVVQYLLGQMSFERQLKYLAQNSLRDRLNAFHDDLLELIDECEMYLFEYDNPDDDDKTKKSDKLPMKLPPARSGEAPPAEKCSYIKRAEELIAKIDQCLKTTLVGR